MSVHDEENLDLSRNVLNTHQVNQTTFSPVMRIRHR